MTSNIDVKTKITASIYLYAMADTIIYNNGTNIIGKDQPYVELGIINEMLYDFIDRGGINGINFSQLHVSINTIINIATIKSLLDINKNDDYKTYINIYMDNYIGVYDYIGDLDYRGKKVKTVNYLEIFFLERKRGIKPYLAMILTKIADNGIQAATEEYNKEGYDYSAAIRTIPIGLAYYGDYDKLIKMSLDCSRITNNSPIGYLAGLTCSLFAAYGMNGIDIKKWPFLMIDIMKSQSVMDTITEENEEHYDYFMLYWEKYINLKFNDGEIINSKSNKNLIYRYKFYIDNIVNEKLFEPSADRVGITGYDATIIAYDCLLDSEGKWEKLIIYSGLHLGQTTEITSIAAGLFGVYYGWGDISTKTLEHLEFRDLLEEYSNKMINKFT